MSTPKPVLPTIEVVCAIWVKPNNQILATKRPDRGPLANKWEFPGGKIEIGEDHETAIRREIWEELRVGLGDLVKLCPVTHQYDFGIIRLWPFLCQCQTSPAFTLTEHSDCCWTSLEESRNLDWAPADLPILDQLNEIFEKYERK